ncbi:MAG TPA: hypothetical protein PK339_08495 [Flavitalea sp.]|nr:hypothetical protein [Flavitalea sp.]
MKKGSYLIAVFVFLLAGASSLRAQRLDSLLNILETNYAQEKLYLHFDRNAYNPGETIWFKAYLFSANLPSPISRSVYFELLDEHGKPLERKVSPVVSSSAAAAFDLPSDIGSSVVYVRAFTQWMLNFDSSFLYVKAIPILQPAKAAAKVSNPAPRVFLQFFPEGGDLVSGVSSRVAFKATDDKGIPIKVSGEIRDSKGKTAASFSSVHDGMGFFTLTPAAQEKYKASWKDESGKTHQTNLPDVKKQGFTLSVDQDMEAIQFGISRSEGETSSPSAVSIVGQMQQQMVYMAKANILPGKTVNGKIPVEQLPAGILQITIFSDNKPLAERIIFVNKQDYYFITDLNAALKGFEKRRRNVIQIDVPDTLRTNLSVSVTDAEINPRQDNEEDIFSHVLLTSDIKGYVHRPAYYFSSEADSVIKHLDLVMMTNGWRRFSWEQALAGKFPKLQYLPEDYLEVQGKITGLSKSQLTGKELTGIMDIAGKQQFLNIPVDGDGAFSIPGIIFYDTARLYYQFNNDKDKILTSRASFDIKNNILQLSPSLKPDTNWVYRLPQPGKEVLQKNQELAAKNNEALDEQRRKVQTLQEVTVTARQKSKKELLEEEYVSGMFRGGEGYTFIMEDDPLAGAAQSVLAYLQGRVPGLQITVNGPNASLSWRGGSPSLFINEMQGDVSQVQTLHMSEVAMVKVFRPPFFGAPGGGAAGAIAIYTKKGGAVNQDIKGLDFAKIPGYSPVKQFYSPDYMRYDESHAQPDYRPTLHWDPFVLTDKNSRRIMVSFYNNDITRKFRIVIEGCNEEGRLTRIEKIFEP